MMMTLLVPVEAVIEKKIMSLNLNTYGAGFETAIAHGRY
jgi:hypothetical protein